MNRGVDSQGVTGVRITNPRIVNIDRLRVVEVSRGEKMLYSETDAESYITEYTLVYEENPWRYREGHLGVLGRHFRRARSRQRLRDKLTLQIS